MEISYRHKFIFIHIWKNAGTSVRNAVKPYAYQVGLKGKITYRLCEFLNVNPGEKLSLAYRATSPHLKAKDIRDLLGQKAYNEFYSFSFSRNPYTRLVSQYTKISVKESHKHHNLAKDLGSFEEYVKWRINSGKETFQWQFVTDHDQNRIVNFVGKFEHLQKDLSHVGQHLQIDLGLNHLNKTQRSDDKSVKEYYSESLIDFVKLHYERDFEFFEYDIDEIP